MTLKDPANFAVTLDSASYFTIENIRFDYNYGNPSAVNMDGIHFNGNCHYGVINNLPEETIAEKEERTSTIAKLRNFVPEKKEREPKLSLPQIER